MVPLIWETTISTTKLSARARGNGNLFFSTGPSGFGDIGPQSQVKHVPMQSISLLAFREFLNSPHLADVCQPLW